MNCIRGECEERIPRKPRRRALSNFFPLSCRRIYNFATLQEYYNWSSAVNYLHGIKVPMIFINALDDPLLCDILHSPVREFAGKRTSDEIITVEKGAVFVFSYAFQDVDVK